MRIKVFAVALFAWAFGVACGLGYVAVSGGWYEYHLLTDSETHGYMDWINRDGWQIVPNVGSELGPVYLRRPRLRLP